MFHIKKFLFVVIMASEMEAANILAIVPYPARSHYLVIEPLLKRLAEKGHNIDTATHHPHENNKRSNYNEISLVGSIPPLTNNMPISLLGNASLIRLIQFAVMTGGVNPCKGALKTAAFQALKQTEKKYDLVITHLLGSDCMLAFGYHFKTAVISLDTGTGYPFVNARIGNPDNPSYIPSFFVSLTSRMSFSERIENACSLTVSKGLYKLFSTKKSNEVAKEFFGANTPLLEDLAKNTSLLLVNSHFSMNHIRPTVPQFIEIAGIHIGQPKRLPKYFTDLFETSTGIIYLSMGSMVMTETFDFVTLQGMFDAFAELPYQVLWKVDKDKFPKGLVYPENIHFEKWMPQLDILCHPKVKLFITHGGLLGSQEAIYCGVPRIGIPFFADQENNVCTAEKAGTAVRLAYGNINKETLLTAVKKILEDPNYKANVERLSQKFKDRPMAPLDVAVYWTEYVVKHKIFEIFEILGTDLPWYEYYLIDVISCVVITLIVASYLTALLIKFCFAIIHKKCYN